MCGPDVLFSPSLCVHVYSCSSSRPLQVTNLRDEVARVQQVLSNKEEESAESIQKAAADLQKASLKLFEMAYKKVRVMCSQP